MRAPLNPRTAGAPLRVRADGRSPLHRPRQRRPSPGRDRGRPRADDLPGGAGRFELPGRTLTATPPFGLAHLGEHDGVVAGPLLEALAAEATVAAVLVRLGGYAVGVFDGERLATSKAGARFVKGRHRAGGSSSNRFRRRREGQERELVDERRPRSRAVLAPWRERVEHVALGGDRAAVRRLLASRHDLAWLEPRALPRFFAVPEPRLRVLEDLRYQLYAAAVAEEP